MEAAAQEEELDAATADRLFDAVGILIASKSAAYTFAEELTAALWRVNNF